jgi:hypothetical protein
MSEGLTDGAEEEATARTSSPRLHHLGGARRSRCSVASWWLLVPRLSSATGEESAPSWSGEGAGDFTHGRDNEQGSSALPEALGSSVGEGNGGDGLLVDKRNKEGGRWAGGFGERGR